MWYSIPARMEMFQTTRPVLQWNALALPPPEVGKGTWQSLAITMTFWKPHEYALRSLDGLLGRGVAGTGLPDDRAEGRLTLFAWPTTNSGWSTDVMTALIDMSCRQHWP